MIKPSSSQEQIPFVDSPDAHIGLPQIDPERAARIDKATRVRAAFRSAMFPGYHGLNEEELNDAIVPEDAYRQSNPAALRGYIHEVTPLSMRQGRRTGRWVLLSAVEAAGIINFPEEFAQGADTKNRTTQSALYREHGDRLQASSRAGAHALERPLLRMNHLLDGYGYQTDILRSLVPMIKNDWHANKTASYVREAVMTARDGFHGTLKAVAEAKGWSDGDLELVQTGLDKRLLSGRGNEELKRKKAEWTSLTRMLGNYTIDKKVLVRNRAERMESEIERRMRKGQST